MSDISKQETRKMPVPPNVPIPPKGEVSGFVMLQPLPDGRAIARIDLNQMVGVTLMVPADVVRAFVGEYLQQQKKNQALVHAVRKLSH